MHDRARQGSAERFPGPSSASWNWDPRQRRCCQVKVAALGARDASPDSFMPGIYPLSGANANSTVYQLLPGAPTDGETWQPLAWGGSWSVMWQLQGTDGSGALTFHSAGVPRTPSTHATGTGVAVATRLREALARVRSC